MSGGHNRSVKNYVLDARYQLRFALVMSLVAAVLMVGLGVGVMKMVRSATIAKVNRIRDFSDRPDERIRALQAQEEDIKNGLIGAGIVLTGALFAYGVWLTHKTAGPIHKIGQHLDEMRGGRFAEVRPLRKGDHLKDFFEHFREAHESLRRRQEQDVTLLRDVVEQVRKAGLQDRAERVAKRLDALEALAQEKESGLG